ncbi:MAG: hypothetical protein CMJ75_11985 [Planctomycetaceae bacterium]|nr:hypothetical protein [Planctomycetaceae bacterium]
MTTRFLASSFLLCFMSVSGCGPTQPVDSDATGEQADVASAAPVDPHDIPLTEGEIDQLRDETVMWAAALERIQEFAATIELETTSGAPAKAHRALDLVDYVLQWLPDIAQTSKVPKDHWQTIGENTQVLRDAFNVLHANIDAGKEPGYEAVAADIKVAIEALVAIKPAATEGAPPAE